MKKLLTLAAAIALVAPVAGAGVTNPLNQSLAIFPTVERTAQFDGANTFKTALKVCATANANSCSVTQPSGVDMMDHRSVATAFPGHRLIFANPTGGNFGKGDSFDRVGW